MSILSGMKHVKVLKYRPRLPKPGYEQLRFTSGIKEINTRRVAVTVNVGFVQEAPDTSVSGFCIYHRNRLIKPFWQVYTSASSIGRGVIGFLDVDFVAPAHDKQVLLIIIKIIFIYDI